MADFAAKLEAVRRRIRNACEACGRDPGEITLLAVSKFKPAEAIREAALCGQVDFGENYAQHMVEKMDALSDLPLRWHFIGGLQRNKAKYLVGRIAWLHTLDSLKLLAEVARQSEKQRIVTRCLIEVNVGEEGGKSGVALADLAELISAASQQPNVQLDGLMSIPPYHDDPQAMRPYHRTLRRTRDEMQERFGTALPVLSMGMSNDLEVAIEEGATLLRVGTDLFGER